MQGRRRRPWPGWVSTGQSLICIFTNAGDDTRPPGLARDTRIWRWWSSLSPEEIGQGADVMGYSSGRSTACGAGWPVRTGLRLEPAMVASSDVNHLVEGIVAPPSTVSFRGKPQIWFSRSDDDVTYGVVHPLEGIVLEHELPGRGSAGGAIVIYHVEVGVSRRRGAAGSRFRVDGLTLGGAVWHCGDADGRPVLRGYGVDPC